MELLVYPAIFFLWRKHTLRKEGLLTEQANSSSIAEARG